MKVLLACFCIYIGVCFGENTEDSEDLSVATIEYLRRYQYYTPPENAGALASLKNIRNSVRQLQDFAGLPETGLIDKKTKELIETPRCGMPDITNAMQTKRKRRYTLQGTKWNSKNKLTWRLKNDNNDGLTREQVERTLQNAFSKWQAITNMDFQKLPHTYQGSADIEVKFVTAFHDDPYPFDGPGGTLAHAFYPHTNEGLSGDVHFDDDEKYTLGKDGRNLLWVAVHEIGHSLGLEHSNVQAAVMYPWYKSFKGDDFNLNYDDIVGVQNLYGSRSGPKPPTEPPVVNPKTTTTTTTKAKRYVGCTSTFKAVFLDPNTKNTYVVNDDKVYILDRNLKLKQGPKSLSSMFPNIDRADAVYTRRDGRIVFFKDTEFFVFESVADPRLVDQGYIFSKYRGLPQTVKKIDAAFVWSQNGRTYLFVGDRYFRYNENQQNIDINYPRSIASAWKNVPSNVDAVFEWSNGVTYFFKGGEYYRLNNKNIRVAYNYPRSILKVWTRCSSGSLVSELSGANTIISNKILLLVTLLGVMIGKYF